MKRILLICICLLAGQLLPAQDTVIVRDTIRVTDTLRVVTPVADTLKKEQSNIQKISEKIDQASKDLLGISPVEDTLNGAPDLTGLISISKIFWAIVLLTLGYFTIKIIARILEILAEKSTRYRITIKSFIPLVRIMGWLGLVSLVVAGVFRPQMATLVAFSASVGVAIGFASQDILKNIFGGIMILFDQPFKSGDKIEIGSYYGEVVEIGLRSTRIVTPDDNLVSIPNSEIMNSGVSNANAGEANCQVQAEIYLPVGIDTMEVRNIATEVAQVSKYVYLNKPVTIIFLNEFKEKSSVIKMRMKAYVLDIRDEFKFKSEMTELVLQKLVEKDILKPGNDSFR